MVHFKEKIDPADCSLNVRQFPCLEPGAALGGIQGIREYQLFSGIPFSCVSVLGVSIEVFFSGLKMRNRNPPYFY